MNKILKYFLSLLVTVTILITSPLSVFAWGPDRETFTMDEPAGFITFNSIEDNNNEVGNELCFVSAREYGTSNNWSDYVTVERGKKYVVRMYVHNNAAGNLSLIAENVKAFLNVPNDWATKITVDGIVSSDNATPSTVWDQTSFESDEVFALAYIPDSAKYYNNAGVFNLPDSILTSAGALLGYEQMDGLIPGCNGYSGYVTIILEALFYESRYEDMVLNTWVRKNESDNWSESIEAIAGDLLQFRMELRNTGNSTIWNLIARWYLADFIHIVENTTEIYINDHSEKEIIYDNLIATQGTNIGHIKSGSTVWLYFSAQVGEPLDSTIADCVGTIANKADISITDAVTVVVQSRHEQTVNIYQYFQGEGHVGTINIGDIVNNQYQNGDSKNFLLENLWLPLIVGIMLLIIAFLFAPLGNTIRKKFKFFKKAD